MLMACVCVCMHVSQLNDGKAIIQYHQLAAEAN